MRIQVGSAESCSNSSLSMMVQAGTVHPLGTANCGDLRGDGKAAQFEWAGILLTHCAMRGATCGFSVCMDYAV